MIRVMLDSDQLDALTPDAPLNATYADLVPNSADLRKRLAGSQLVLIDRGDGDPAGEATAIDVERGLHKPADVRGWVERKQLDGKRDLIVYANRDTWPQIEDDTRGLRFARWYATLDGTAHIDGLPALRDPAAIQCIGSVALGVHADLSLVFDDGWMPAPEPEWAVRARGLARVVLSEIQHADGSVGALATLLSEKH